MILFTYFADFLVYTIFELSADTKISGSLHFFFEDISKIFVLLIILIYLISLLRAGLQPERIRNFLSGKKRGVGYILASLFGAVTPFCSCSSIPLFMGFTQAGIPLGITMAFLITSPIVNEIALVLLGSLLGWKFMVLYAGVGIIAGVLGGLFIDLIKADRYLTPFAQNMLSNSSENTNRDESSTKISLSERNTFALTELRTILKRVWIWVFAGVGIGALFHGFVPESFILNHLGAGKIWTVPAAVGIGIPLYSNATGIIPVAESLLQKGLPLGTTLAFMMSTVAASLPEFMMLKQVMKIKLLLIFFAMLLFFFTLTGWIFNFFPII
jgi:uncharacterized protein